MHRLNEKLIYLAIEPTGKTEQVYIKVAKMDFLFQKLRPIFIYSWIHRFRRPRQGGILIKRNGHVQYRQQGRPIQEE